MHAAISLNPVHDDLDKDYFCGKIRRSVGQFDSCAKDFESTILSDCDDLETAQMSD